MNFGGVIRLNKTAFIIVGIVLVIIYLYCTKQNVITANGVHTDQIDLRKLLTVAIRASQNGGKEILDVKDSIKIENKGKTKEGLNDTVTTADFNSHCVMKQTLLDAYPNLSVISEEEKAQCKDAIKINNDALENSEIPDLHETWINREDITVWIDPLDATKEFTEKLYQFVTTMVCVAVKGEPVIGVIYKPFSKETSWAWVGNGRSQNLLNQVEKPQQKKRIIVSMSHAGKIKEMLLKSYKEDEIEIISAAGAGYKVLEVIAGNADAYVHSTAIKKWDICAGNAILNSYGGKMTTKENKSITYLKSDNVVNENGLIATLKDHDSFIGKF